MKRRFQANIDELPEVMSFTEEELEQHDFSMKDIMMIQVAVEEIFANIASYAYEDGDGYCDMEIEDEGDDIIMTFTDEGIAFDPLEKEDPDIHCDVEDRQIGGLGIYMTKKIMDDVRYQRTDNKNILTITKKKVIR